MKTYNCQTCGTELKRYEAHLRGNAIDSEPAAWCRVHAIAAGIFMPPMPPAPVPVPEQRSESPNFLSRLFA